jgi:hypothetical protein
MKEIANTRLVLLTIAISVVTANAYYIHPIMALNQIAAAAGILLLLP